jgi:hypothetical protein
MKNKPLLLLFFLLAGSGAMGQMPDGWVPCDSPCIMRYVGGFQDTGKGKIKH